MRKNLVNLTRWFETCVHQPHFQEVLGAVHLCSKADHFDDTKFQQHQHQPSAKQSNQAREGCVRVLVAA